jgi:TP901 family phage tail tape measure protein
MAFETLGIGGVLTFNDTQAVRGMTRTKTLMRSLEMRAQRLSAGMRRLGSAVKGLGIASIASAAAMGFGAKAAASFEHQMGAVLGIETAFSATESAKAMEILGKFGLTKNALRIATKGVTDLAAATGTNMESAATTMIGTLKSMSLTSKDSTRVANVLALASTKTAANAIGLGEAFAYAGSTAKSMNMSVEMTTAVFGSLADKMMIGSRAGTGLMALMRGLQANTNKVRKTMKGLGIDIEQFGGDMSKMPAIIQHVSEQLNKHFPKATDKIARARAVTHMFGRFGQVTFNNLAATGKKKLQELANALKKSGKTAKDKFGNPIGAAAEMAQKRLNTVNGAITLFKSSMESFFISIMGGFLGPMKTRLQALTANFNKVLFIMNAFEKDDSFKNQQKQMKKYGETSVLVALGVRDALKLVRDSWAAVGNQIRRVGAMFGGVVEKGMLRTVIKFGLGFTMLLATLAPVFIGLFALKFIIGTVASAVSGLALVVSAVALPIVAAVGIVAAAFFILRREGETVRETFMRLFTGVYAFGRSILSSVIMPMFGTIVSVIKGFTVEMEAFWMGVVGRLRGVIYSLIGTYTVAVKTIGGLLRVLVDLIGSVALKMRAPFKAIIKFMLTIGEVIADVAKAVWGLFSAVAKWAKMIINGLKPILLDIVGFIAKIASAVFSHLSRIFKVLGFIVKRLLNGFKNTLNFLRPILGIFLKLIRVMWAVGKVIVNFILIPFRIWWGIALKIYDLVKGPLKTVFWGIVGVLKTIVGVIKTVARFVFTLLLRPFKFMAGLFAKLMWKAAKLAKYIPGMTGESIRGLASALESFAGVKAIKVSARGELLARRGKISGTSLGPGTTGRLFPATRDAGKRTTKINLVDKRKTDLNAKTSIDGRCVAAATSRHQVELSERAGFGSSPWQRRAVVARSGLINPRGRD